MKSIHIVMPGDTLWRIAMIHGVSFNQLMNANAHIKNPSLIYPGDKINIPVSNNTNYTVNKNDTMWDISQQYNVPLNQLQHANPQIKNPNLIYPGQQINIPSETQVYPPTLPPTNTQTENPGVSGFDNMEREVARLVNIERAKNGLPALTFNNKISNVARIKSEDFIKNNYFSHNSPVYGTPFEMLKQFDVSYRGAAENIASGQKNPSAVMQTWMNSPGHRANILNRNYNQIGVGVARDTNGNLYWTQLFITT